MRDLSALPAPVARYLNHSLPDNQPRIRRLRLKQVVQLRTSAESSRWLRFHATQTTDPLKIAYEWNARGAIAPLVHIQVRDSYRLGIASRRVRLLSFLPLASGAASPELNAGSLHRYLAEAAWYPTALLPSEALRWSALDGNKALATLTDSNVSVSLEFRFNEANEISSVYTPGRWELIRGGYRLTAWEGRFSDYRRSEQMLIPSAGEVGWYRAGNWQKVWTGSVVESRYEYGQ